MKTHSLLNVLLKLKTNRPIKFRRISDGLIISADEKGDLNWESGYKKFNFDDKFELVQEPVTFQEAVKAFAEGKTIRCELEGVGEYCDTYKRDGLSNIGGYDVQNVNGVAVGSTEILNGRWFIKEED